MRSEFFLGGRGILALEIAKVKGQIVDGVIRPIGQTADAWTVDFPEDVDCAFAHIQ